MRASAVDLIDKGQPVTITKELDTNTITVSLDLPRDLLGALDIPESGIEDALRELIALQLYTDGRISAGKGAELLGVTKLAFIRLLARHDIPYLTDSPEELEHQVAALAQLLRSEDG